MSLRYSREEKGKARSDNTFQRKPLVRVPESDITELVERNKLTLIGRVTNPAIQKTRALVDFFLQHWSVAGKITGRDLGPTLFHQEADKARLRVSVNGLQPLIMKMDLQLPSQEVVEIELEYEYLQKHCFHCKSLCHEDDDCPNRDILSHQREERRNLGISQQNTLDSIEESRRRHEDRKRSRQYQSSKNGGARWTNYKKEERAGGYDRKYHRQSPPLKRRETPMSSDSGFDENRRRYDDRNLSRHTSPSRRRMTDSRSLSKGSSPPLRSQAREYQVVERIRENRASPVREAHSKSSQSPATAPRDQHKRTSISSRLSDPRERQASGEDRISAKERLSVHTQRTSRSALEVQQNEPVIQPLSESRNMEVAIPPRFCDSITRPSSSNIFETGRLGPGERSPIRTLSEDRIHVSLRLGPLLSDNTEETEESNDQPIHPAQSKAEGKKIARRRTVRNSPKSGVSMKRKRTTKAQSSPRRKLMLDAIATGGRTTKKAQSKRKQKKGLFRFDRRLKGKPEIRKLVEEQWSEEPFEQYPNHFKDAAGVRGSTL
ncbi:zf-CCHC_4 domain-containing protein [Raphanus sativus]|nr:zf-CCHC_4 domain-containing protein [Raphanus sativus]